MKFEKVTQFLDGFMNNEKIIESIRFFTEKGIQYKTSLIRFKVNEYSSLSLLEMVRSHLDIIFKLNHDLDKVVITLNPTISEESINIKYLKASIRRSIDIEDGKIEEKYSIIVTKNKNYIDPNSNYKDLPLKTFKAGKK